MKLTQQSLSNPVAVVVAILLVLLFGTIGLFRLPIQMIPTVERPIIEISTRWRSAAPEEVESEILEQQEDALRGLPGVDKMEASASRGFAQINLEFEINIDLQRALIEVMNRLNRVPRYPPDADEPVVYAGRGSFGSSIAWFALRTQEGNTRDIDSYHDFVEEIVQARVERVNGIANSNAYGGRPMEVRITFDPYKAAAYGIDIPTLAGLTGNNNDVSGGFAEIGRRRYTLRYSGKYDLRDFGDMVLAWRDGNPIHLTDIATIDTKMVDRSGILSQNGGPSIAFNAQPEEGVNVLKVMKELKLAIAELNEGVVEREGLRIVQVYDETLYITQSISMLRNNLLLGIILAVGVLWWFMRKLRATLIVALAIPVSLFVAFTALEVSGRTLNIISLAGLAFAMGMVLDAAIVVLENIVRLRESGKSSHDASFEGVTHVWGALLASTATTVAIFLPLIFLRDISGQLFADLAFTISVAVVTSLVIAVTIIPTAGANWLKNVELSDPHVDWWDRITATIMRLTNNRERRLAWIAGLILISVSLSWSLLPPRDYLPTGKQNWIFAFILPPPGQSVDSAESEFTDVVNERMLPYLSGEKEPHIHNYFLGVFGSFGFMGARPVDRDDVDAVLDVLNGQILQGFPDTMAFASRPSIFFRLGGGRDIELNIQSRDIDAALRAAATGMYTISSLEELAGVQVRPVPGLELAEPELRLIPDERRIVEAGWNRQTMAGVIRALGDGLFVGEYFNGERTLDVVLRADSWISPEELASLPIATPARGIQSVGDLVKVERTAGPDQIRRVDRRRTITLNITPPKDLTLEETVAILQEKAEPAIRAQLPDDGDVFYHGSADNLNVALANMARSFGLAIIILYLLMSALFRSFKDSLLVLLALPLATVGGIISLKFTDWAVFQPMDLLTMIGFITLMGLVVNNAILLVHQTRRSERQGMARRDAVQNAVRIRLRPILMSTLTSLFGMMPLLLIPGPGTELYRGMAAVIVGGMSVSTVFTLILLPSLLRLGEEAPEGMTGKTLDFTRLFAR